MQCIGYQQIDAATLASMQTLNVPEEAKLCRVQAEAQSVRYRFDVAPTTGVGMLVVAGAHQPVEITAENGMRQAMFIGAAGGAILNVLYFG